MSREPHAKHATIRDIADHKPIERDLSASKPRYRRLADTMPQLIWTADASDGNSLRGAAAAIGSA